MQTSHFGPATGQINLLDGGKSDKWQRALSAADRMRDKYGDGSVSLAASMRGQFRERVHEAMPNAPRGKPESG